MSTEAISTIGELLLTALIAVAGGTYTLYRRWRTAQRAAIDSARAEALAQARSEALIREAQAALDTKGAELHLVHAHLAATRVDLSDCNTARADLRTLLLACQGGGS